MAEQKAHKSDGFTSKIVLVFSVLLLVSLIGSLFSQFGTTQDTPTTTAIVGQSDEFDIETPEIPRGAATLDTPAKSGIKQYFDIVRPMRVHYIDVGQADSTLIELPNGEDILIDGGEQKDGKFIIDYLKKQGVDDIEYLIATHPHADHIGGLDTVIDAIPVDMVYMPFVLNEPDTKEYTDLLAALDRNGLIATAPEAGTYPIWDTQNKLIMEILAPSKDEYVSLNNYSIVFQILYKDTSFLFPGDAEDILEFEIIDSGLNVDIDVLKIGHHGSDTSTSGAFLAATSPRYGIISVGANNTYGHPSEDVLAKLEEEQVEVYRTDIHGTIVVTSDGEKIEIKTEKNAYVKADPVEDPVTKAMEADKQQYIGNKNSKIFHELDCGRLPDEKNRVYINGYNDAISQSFRPCENCKPSRHF